MAAAQRKAEVEDYFETAYAPTVRKEKTEFNPREKTKLEKMEKTDLPIQEVKTNAKRTLLISAGVVIFACVLMVYCLGLSKLNDAGHELADLQAQLELQQSRYRQLQSEQAALVSPEKVEEIAVEKLGLIKLNEADWQYLNIDKGNRIVISQADGN